MGISLVQLKERMRCYGARKLLFKKLSPNDNSKNQIYLGSDYSALSLLPLDKVYSDTKDRAHSRTVRYKTALNVYWLCREGLYPAPHAQMILYPKYPEVRMSGLLKDCPQAPSEVLTVREKGRVLFFGITEDLKIIAFAAHADHPAIRELETLPAFNKEDLLIDLPIDPSISDDGRVELLQQLARIHDKGWINSYRLDANGVTTPCGGTNCGGYTLEAELGITPNGYAEPDFYGWEIKQHNVRNLLLPESGGAITLMTPEPTNGYYNTEGVEAFVRKFGYKDTKGRVDRLNFGGVHRFGQLQERTKLTLELTGYNIETKRIEDTDGGVSLVSAEGEVAAAWLYSDLIYHWNKKHAQAVYVPSVCKTDVIRMYKYGPLIRMGIGTDFDLLLQAFMNGHIYYDPGIKVEQASVTRPRIKRRSQFRIHTKNIPVLYKAVEWADLSQLRD